MKHRYVRILIALTLMFTWLGFRSIPASAAGLCKNTGCEGLNPATMQCPATRSGSVKVLPDGASIVETRKSGTSDCDAKWARTTNQSGGSRYAAASLRYGCSNYCYNQSVTSPGTISNGQVVYTPMHAYAATPTRSCGKVSTSGPISIPIGISDTYCTGAN
jgi:hypothetical protein